MPDNRSNGGGYLLGRRGDFKPQAEFVCMDFLDRLERSQGAVLAIEADVKDIVIPRSGGAMSATRRPC
jgi:hypothetical protein